MDIHSNREKPTIINLKRYVRDGSNKVEKETLTFLVRNIKNIVDVSKNHQLYNAYALKYTITWALLS